MTEEKLKEIKKEKLDDIYIDDKELVNKNKKKTKTKASKKHKAIDFMDYAKEKGLDINLQYEESKPIEFPKDYKYNRTNNNKNNYIDNKKDNKESSNKNNINIKRVKKTAKIRFPKINSLRWLVFCLYII